VADLFQMPERFPHGTAPIQIGSDGRRLDLTDPDLSHGLAEGFEDLAMRGKTETQRLFQAHVMLNGLVQFHSSPPRSKAAMARRPAKSTLA